MNRHFNVLVAGDNHSELMAIHDVNFKYPKYTAYRFKDAEKYRQEYLRSLESVVDTDPSVAELIEEIKNEDVEDFYLDLTKDYELDPETGDAITSKNPDGKYDTAKVAKNFAVPFKLKDGSESYSARKGDIDWDLTAFSDKKPYETAWDLVMGGKKPRTAYEKNIYNNMKNRTTYFEAFGSKENYVLTSTAFWCYAFVSEKGKWTEFDETGDQFKWVKDFYRKFVKNLSDNTLLTLYECTRY